jgi:hypothetical protein
MYIYIDIQKEKEQSLVLVWSSKNIIIQKNVLPQKRWKQFTASEYPCGI